MSDAVKCDRCENIGNRKIGTLAPIGWFYLEANDDDDPSNCLIIWACSKKCAYKLWQAGPGKLDFAASWEL